MIQLRDVCDLVYVEDGVSAVSKTRPVYDQVMNDLDGGDVFVVLALDRAFRSSLDALKELDRLLQRNIQFLSLSQNFDTRTPEGKLLYTVVAALAEWERQTLSQRTREGLEAARRRGATLGRPRKLSDEQIEEIKTTLIKPNPPSLKFLANQYNVHPVTLKRALD